MFIVGTPTQIYRFLASSEREKEKWESKLRKCIEKEKQAFVEVSLNMQLNQTEFVTNQSLMAGHHYFLYSFTSSPSKECLYQMKNF